MPDPVWTADDLAAVERAISSGELSVQYQDRSVRYRSIDELLRARDVIKNALEGASATKIVARQGRAVVGSGYR